MGHRLGLGATTPADQCLQVAISFCRHRSVPIPCENGSVETTVAEGGQNPIAGLWGRTLVDHLSRLPVMPSFH